MFCWIRWIIIKIFQKYTVVQQDPLPGSKVKDGRKIYIKVNSADFGMVTMPDLIEKTLRQTESSLIALGLEVGKRHTSLIWEKIWFWKCMLTARN